MKKNRKFRLGFTLLELIVVVSIITIMTMVMLVTMFEDRENRELTAAARGVTAAIREAQNNALSGLSRDDKLPCSFSFELNGDTGYDVKRSVRESDSTICTESTIASYAIDYDVKRIDAGNSNHLSEIVFGVPHGTMIIIANDGTIYDPPSDPKKIKLMKNAGKAFFICVYPSGQIIEAGIQVPPFICPS